MLLCRQLKAYLDSQLIPLALVQGGVKLSVALMSHMCTAVLPKSPALLQGYLPHVVHMAAFSLFQVTVSQAAALQQQKCDASILLPSRVVLCAFLEQLARWADILSHSWRLGVEGCLCALCGCLRYQDVDVVVLVSAAAELL